MGFLEWSICVESNFGVKNWAALPSIHTPPGHILENTKNSCRCGCEFLSDLIDLYFWATTMTQSYNLEQVVIIKSGFVLNCTISDH